MALVRLRSAVHLQVQAKTLSEYRRLLPLAPPREDNFPLLHVPLQHTLLRFERVRVPGVDLETYETMRLPVSFQPWFRLNCLINLCLYTSYLLL